MARSLDHGTKDGLERDNRHDRTEQRQQGVEPDADQIGPLDPLNETIHPSLPENAHCAGEAQRAQR